MIVALGVAGEEAADERDERDPLEVGAALTLCGVLLVAHQRLEAMRVAQRLGGERRHDLTEANVGVGERLGVAVRAQENRTDGRALPLNRYDDDRADVAPVELALDEPQRRVARGVGNEHRFAGVERALQLGIAVEIDDEVANRRIFVAGDEPDLVLLGGEEDRAPVEAEGIAELARDRLEDVDEMQRGGDFLQDVDDRDEMVAFALQLAYASAKARDLIIPPI